MYLGYKRKLLYEVPVPVPGRVPGAVPGRASCEKIQGPTSSYRLYKYSTCSIYGVGVKLLRSGPPSKFSGLVQYR